MGPATLRRPEYPLHNPDRPPPVTHPARLILTLSLAATVGLGIGRFAYALVLPDMREELGWSYSAAGFMNTINAVGYLVGALVASRLIRRAGCDHRAIAPGAGQFPAEFVLCRTRRRHSLFRADRTVHTAAFRTGLVV